MRWITHWIYVPVMRLSPQAYYCTVSHFRRDVVVIPSFQYWVFWRRICSFRSVWATGTDMLRVQVENLPLNNWMSGKIVRLYCITPRLLTCILQVSLDTEPDSFENFGGIFCQLRRSSKGHFCVQVLAIFSTKSIKKGFQFTVWNFTCFFYISWRDVDRSQ